jgi:hypothetical protein
MAVEFFAVPQKAVVHLAGVAASVGCKSFAKCSKVQVTSQLTIRRTVYLGVEPLLGLMIRFYVTGLNLTAFVPSDEGTGLSFRC